VKLCGECRTSCSVDCSFGKPWKESQNPNAWRWQLVATPDQALHCHCSLSLSIYIYIILYIYIYDMHIHISIIIMIIIIITFLNSIIIIIIIVIIIYLYIYIHIYIQYIYLCRVSMLIVTIHCPLPLLTGSLNRVLPSRCTSRCPISCPSKQETVHQTFLYVWICEEKRSQTLLRISGQPSPVMEERQERRQLTRMLAMSCWNIYWLIYIYSPLQNQRSMIWMRL
jgi:hypothetical protein